MMPCMIVYELIGFDNALLDHDHLPNGQKWVILENIKKKLIQEKKTRNATLILIVFVTNKLAGSYRWKNVLK